VCVCVLSVRVYSSTSKRHTMFVRSTKCEEEKDRK
jgi:hypothetical protein